MAILFMIGRGEEDETVIDLLYDIEILKERPNYNIAPENGLILSECGYDDIEWSNPLFSDLETFNVFKRQHEENALDMSLNEIMLENYEQRYLESQKIIKSVGITVTNPKMLDKNEKLTWNQMLNSTTMKKGKEKLESSIIRQVADG